MAENGWGLCFILKSLGNQEGYLICSIFEEYFFGSSLEIVGGKKETREAI